MGDNLNTILIEGSGYLLNNAFDLDSIKGNNEKHLENMSYHCFKIYENACPLYLDKPTFCHFACCIVMRHEHEGQSYSTSYYIKIVLFCAHLLHCKGGNAWIFRFELSHFMSVMRRTIA